MEGGSNTGQSVHTFLLARQGRVYAALGLALESYVKGSGTQRFAVAVSLRAELLDRRPATTCQGLMQAGGVGGTDNQPSGRNGAHQVVKLGLDGMQIREDIGMVVFQ